MRLIDPVTNATYLSESLTDGTFQIPAVPAGTYDVRAEGYAAAAPAQLTVSATPRVGLQIVVTAGGSISGSVAVNPGGTPLVNVPISAHGAAGWFASCSQKACFWR